MIIDDYIKNCKLRTSWQCEKKKDQNFPLQGFFVIFQTNIHLLSTKWLWSTCNFWSNGTSTKNWVRHGDFTFTHIPSITTFKCKLLN
jgi:hypothetical protein